jgi:hypothetical protein
VFFAGSLCFTTAAALQCRQAVTRTDRWAAVIQLAGTVFFDLSTLHGLQTGLSTSTCHGHRETRHPRRGAERRGCQYESARRVTGIRVSVYGGDAALGTLALRDVSLGVAGPNVRGVPGLGALAMFASVRLLTRLRRPLGSGSPR